MVHDEGVTLAITGSVVRMAFERHFFNSGSREHPNATSRAHGSQDQSLLPDTSMSSMWM
jgi:hypothetical protein